MIRRGPGIRARLLLVATLLLAIPYVGYRYVQEMEGFLRDGQEEALLGAARALAGALHDRPALFASATARRAPDEIYAHALGHPIEIDGYPDDWRALTVRLRDLADPGGAGANDARSFRARYVAGTHATYLYLLLVVNDDRVVHRTAQALRLDHGDHAALRTRDAGGREQRYVLSTSAPGFVPVYEDFGGEQHRLEGRIRAAWRTTPGGWTLEARIPLRLLGPTLAIEAADADDPSDPGAARRAATTFGAPGPLILPSVPIEGLIRSLGRTPGRRVRVVDAQSRVLAHGGSLETDVAPAPVGPLFALLLPPPDAEVFAEETVPDHLATPEVEAALAGNPGSRWRSLPGTNLFVVSAAYPIRSADRIAGAVVVEETSFGIQTVRRQALADLFTRTLVVCLVGALVLLLFATRLSVRLRRLRDEAERAIDAHGRVVGTLSGSAAGDEIGDLARGFAAMMGRLGQYNRYLELLARRLSHELRTPIAVVRSSLEALELDPSTADAPTYVRRAREGLDRLETILGRMSEASRLEQSLAGAERERFDLGAVVAAAVEAYRTTWPGHRFEHEPSETPCPVDGAPDLVVQLLDKLVSNARDFGRPGRPIRVRLTTGRGRTILAVDNDGPLLPEEMHGRLFDSMVSVRSPGSDPEPHLGLGLYIARLIAEFHGAQIEAGNLPDGEGVSVRVSFPALPATEP